MEIKLFPDNQLANPKEMRKFCKYACVLKLLEKVGWSLKFIEYDNLLKIAEGYVSDLYNGQ